MKLFLTFTLAFVTFYSNAQIAKSFYFNGTPTSNTGAYIEKHPTENSYFVASEKIQTGYFETVISKIDSAGNTLWHSSIQHFGFTSSFNAIGDIKVNSTNVFVGTFLFPSVVGSRVVVYKMDLNGVLLDSAVLAVTGGLRRAKSEMAFDADGNIFTSIKDVSDNIYFCKIDPNTMEILSQQIIGHETFNYIQARRSMFTELVGTNSVICYNGVDTVKTVTVNSSAVVVSNNYFLSPDGDATDVEYYNSALHVLINKYFTPSLAADNPIRIITTDLTGATITANNTYAVSNAEVFENLAIDSNGDLYVAGRMQTPLQPGGAIIKIVSGSIIYEQLLAKTDLTEIELKGTYAFASGLSQDGIEDCMTGGDGSAIIIYKKATVVAGFNVASPHVMLNFNNISALIAYNSQNFLDPNMGVGAYEISGAGNTIYTTSLLVSGEDISSNIKSTCANYYNVYAAGPITNQPDYNQLVRDKYERVWNITRAEIDAHIQAYQIGNPNYQTPEVILNWPANGNPSIGQSQQLARYQDLNGNLIYEPLLGEYPLIKGDYCALSIYNDVNSDTAEQCIVYSDRMNIEVFEYAYGFNCDQDSSLQNTLFVYYEVINKSGITNYNSYVGHHIDMDINFPSDDYISSDPLRGMFYQRNETATPGPEQAYLILASEQDEDGLDNADGIGNGESPNGVGYGNGISDDERMGMTNFIYYNNGGGANGGPVTSGDFHNYLQSIWKNGDPVLYGGNGFDIGTTLIESNFMFQGDADNGMWYSTNGIDPGLFWTEESVSNPYGDRRGIASSGPHTFQDKDTIRLDIAYVTGMENTTAGYTSHDALIVNVDSVRSYFALDSTTCDQDFDFYAPFNGIYPSLAVAEKEILKPILFPNPTNGSFTIQGLSNQTSIRIFSVDGQLISETFTNQTSINFDYSDLPKGIYFVQINDDNFSGTLKVVKQ